jgi:hypothetical protein
MFKEKDKDFILEIASRLNPTSHPQLRLEYGYVAV